MMIVYIFDFNFDLNLKIVSIDPAMKEKLISYKYLVPLFTINVELSKMYFQFSFVHCFVLI